MKSVHDVDMTTGAAPLRQRVLRLASTPPSQLGLLLAVLVTLCLATGAAGAADVYSRRSVLKGIAEQSSPLTNAALQIYQSLSDADATANGVFLVGDQATTEPQERYRHDITEAAAALSTASAVAPDGNTANAAAELTAQLPVYAGLVQTAQANNRQGHAVGTSYLQEASELVREHMLPIADRLYHDELARLATAQDKAGAVAWLPVELGSLTLAVLLGVQLYLRRTTRRMLNQGLLVATAAVLVAVGWLALASSSAARHSDAGRRDGSAQIEAIAAARTTALSARSAETLLLIARGDDTSPGSLTAAHDRVSQARTAVDSAIDQWHRWLEQHQKLRDYDDRGDTRSAVRLATGVDTESAELPTAPSPQNPQSMAVGETTEALAKKVDD